MSEVKQAPSSSPSASPQVVRGGLLGDGPLCPKVDPATAPTPRIEQPATIKKLWGASLVILALLVLADLFVHHHAPHFGFETSFGFSAWYGFVTCFLMVVVSKKLVGLLLSVRDTYYDD